MEINVTTLAGRISPISASSAPMHEWVNGERTNQAVLDDKRRPLHKFEGALSLGGATVGSVTIESATPLPEDVPFGTVYALVGKSVLTIRNNKGGRDLWRTLRIEGFEPIKG